MRRSFSRRLIRLVPIRVPDGAGGYAETWQEAGAFWGDVRLRSGSLRVTELGEEPRLRLKITTHALPQDHPHRPASGDRLQDGGRLYLVEAVHEADRKGRYITLFAREVIEGRAS